MEEYTVKLIIRGVPTMTDREFNFLIMWLRKKAKEIKKERNEICKRYISTLTIF
jgi:hypothetical protein